MLVVALAALILIGGPIWLVRNAIERPRERTAAAAMDFRPLAEFWFDTLGSLNREEMTSLLRPCSTRPRVTPTSPGCHG